VTLVDNSGAFDVPGRPGSEYLQFDSPIINGAGQVVFGALFGPGGNDGGLFMHDDGTLRRIADFQDPVPGQPGASFFAFGSPALNSLGHVAFTGRYSDGSGNEGVYFYDGVQIHCVIDESTAILGTTVSNFHMMTGFGGAGDEDGKPQALSNSGHITFRVTLATGEEAILVADVSDAIPAVPAASATAMFALGILILIAGRMLIARATPLQT
jgi:hypothetical protein